MEEETGYNSIKVDKKEFTKLNRDYKTCRIILTILIIGFLMVGATVIYVEKQFRTNMVKCNDLMQDYTKCIAGKIIINPSTNLFYNLSTGET